MPLGFVRFTLSDPFPLLEAALLPKATKKVSPDGVPSDVFGEQIPDVLYRSGQRHVERQLCGAGVVGLKRAEERGICATAVGVEELRGDL